MKAEKNRKSQQSFRGADKSSTSEIDSPPLSMDIEDVRSLQHELEMRQHELAIQNEMLNRAREELQKSRDKNSILYDLAPVGYIGTDTSGIILEANLRLAEMLGTSREQLIGTELAQYIILDSLETLNDHFLQLKNDSASGLWKYCEVRMKKSDGSVFRAHLATVALRDENGQISQFHTGVTEITPLEKSPESIRPQEPPEDTVGEFSPEAVIVTDKNLNLILWNREAELLFGWKAEEALEKPTSIIIRNKVLGFLTETKATESLMGTGSWKGEVTLSNKEGTPVDVHISVSVIWDIFGKFNGLTTIHRPVGSTMPPAMKPANVLEPSDTRALDRIEELTRTNRILQQELDNYRQSVRLAQESEGKNRDLADNIKLGIFRSTPGARGKLLEVNIAMEEITGYSREELLQMDLCNLFENSQGKNQFTDGISVTNWNQTREINLVRKNGDIITVAANIMTIRYDSGKIQYFDGILEDITERKQAQIQIQQSLERLQKTIKEIIQAMAYIGEVRDPYTAGHQRRVARLSLEIARIIGLKEEQYEGLMMAAFVHDIGKILVPADILSKPGKLTKPEFDMIKDHARVGYEILKTIEFPWPLAKIVLQHHERLNGSGYPAGLHGEQIILEARILAVADVVEAMSSHRPYRPALGIEKALAEISQNKGTLYDTSTVDACLKLFNENNFNLN